MLGYQDSFYAPNNLAPLTAQTEKEFPMFGI